VATRNDGKVREIRELLKGIGVRVQSLRDISSSIQVKEDGLSFAENALKKARAYAQAHQMLTIADDSGLEVDALGGRPGVYSARYAAEHASDQENNRKLLEEIAGIPASRRGCRFRCCIAIVSPEGRKAIVEGACRGRIGWKEVGKRGFGYDPLFVLPSTGKTMAQLTVAEKNRVSHRGKALRKLKRIIKDFLH
jgi:XTP/dITP diphosphohydrolase